MEGSPVAKHTLNTDKALGSRPSRGVRVWGSSSESFQLSIYKHRAGTGRHSSGVHKKTLELIGAASQSLCCTATMRPGVIRDIYLHELPFAHALSRPHENSQPSSGGCGRCPEGFLESGKPGSFYTCDHISDLPPSSVRPHLSVSLR